ncbi:MAG TPA: hypothetical protein VHZ98_02415 [Galbitalea sp.]|jgi:hypothetical protein|nr:hypothetical protein [Galbitalea sp.]
MTIPLAHTGQAITITGYPLAAPVTIRDAQPDHTINGEGWLLSVAQAMDLLDAWKDGHGEADVVREYTYSESGLFITGLYLDREIDLSVWESATGSDGDDLYSTVMMPFDFEVQEQKQ